MTKKTSKKVTTKPIKKVQNKRYLPGDKEKYMCAKHQQFFKKELLYLKKKVT